MRAPVRAVAVSSLACEALEEGEGAGQTVAERAVEAARRYLEGPGEKSSGWAYPDFMREHEPAETRELPLPVDEQLWAALEEEAARQEVSIERLIEHAMYHFAVSADGGGAGDS